MQEGQFPVTTISFNLAQGASLGDAVEAIGGSGVGWFTPTGEVLGVEFDDVTFDQDEQSLQFANGIAVRVRVRRGKARVLLDSHRGKPKAA